MPAIESACGSPGEFANQGIRSLRPKHGSNVNHNSAIRAEEDGSRSMVITLLPSLVRLSGEPAWTWAPLGTRSPDVVHRATPMGQKMFELRRPEQAEARRRFHQQSTDKEVSDRVTGSTRRWIPGFLALCCLVLIPWTVGLAMTLPRNYLVGDWPLSWAGFDIILLGCLSTTAWSLWKQRQIAIPAAMISAALLLCDAWFDILTAHPGRCMVLSVATALLAELPIAALLGVTSIELLRVNMDVVRPGEPPSTFQSLWRDRLPASTSVPTRAWASLTDRTHFDEWDRETLAGTRTMTQSGEIQRQTTPKLGASSTGSAHRDQREADREIRRER